MLPLPKRTTPFAPNNPIAPAPMPNPMATNTSHPATATATTVPLHSAQTGHVGLNTSAPDALRMSHSTSAHIVTSPTKNQPSQPQKIPNKVPTPVNPNRLNEFLQGYPDKERIYLIDGFTNGFKIHQDRQITQTVVTPNHPSIKEHTQIAQTMIQEELQAGRLLGPYTTPPFPTYISSPIGVIPKKEPGKFRIIHDLSAPKGTNLSVNSTIPHSAATVQYQLLDHVISLLQNQGSGSSMAKTDIEQAFRQIPIHPSQYNILRFQFDNKFYFDKCLPFGLSSSCQIFERFSCALQWILENKFTSNKTSHLLDDHIFIAKSPVSCANDLQNFISLCDHLGVPIKHSKTIPPATQIIAHGILLDSIQMQAQLPDDKLTSCKQLLHQFSNRKKCTLKELQSLIGHLQFACKVIIPGRAFLRRLINLTIGVSKPHYHISITSEARKDISCWLQFLQNHNGVTVFPEPVWSNSTSINLYADAAGSKGYAIVLGHRWLAGEFPPSWADYHITIKELYPITLSLHVWGHLLTNKRIMFHSDNSACVHIINSQTSKDVNVMKLVRPLVSMALKYNIVFKSVHVPGKLNLIPDLLSRFKFQEALAIAPWLDRHPVQHPAALLPGNMIP